MSVGEDRSFGKDFLTAPDLFPARAGGEPWGDLQLDLDLAGGPYRLSGLGDGQARGVRERFEDRVSATGEDAAPEVPVRVFRAAAADFRDFDRTGREMTLDRRYEERAVSLAGWKLIGRIEVGPRRGAALWTSVAEGPELQGVFENFLRVLVAYRLVAAGGALMHSSGVVDRGRAFLFLGPSGAGKTTVGRLALEGGREVLSDDMNAVIRRQDGSGARYEVERLPFAGDLGQTGARGDRWPLAGFFRLDKGPEESPARLEPLSPARTLAGLLACCPFVNADPHRRDLLTAHLEEMLETVPAGQLTFSRERPFEAISEAITETSSGSGSGARPVPEEMEPEGVE